jgi:hypothetical protein
MGRGLKKSPGNMTTITTYFQCNSRTCIHNCLHYDYRKRNAGKKAYRVQYY